MRFRIPRGWLAFLAFLAMVACSNDRPGVLYRADFDRLAQPTGPDGEETMGVFGGSARTRIAPIDTQAVSFRVLDGRLDLDFEAGGRFQCIPAALGLPASWRNVQKLELNLLAERRGRLLVEVYGSRTRLIDTLALDPAQRVYAVDVTEVPLLGGLDARPAYLRLTALDQQALSLGAMALKGSAPHPFLVDRFGQRARAEWPGKVASLDALRDSSAEGRLLAELPEPLALDAYGGYAVHRLPLEATGFFSAQEAAGRWWLVTPEGNPFYSLGVNGVRIKSIRGNADVSRVAGREWLFETVPEVAQAPECFREEGRYFSYYCWNVLRKYGSKARWRAQTYQRLRAIGFNTIGNWSDTVFYRAPRMPYTYTLDTRRDTNLLTAHRMPDVFHPDWEKHLANTFAEIARFRDDPYLLGYFVDNEMGWRSVVKPDSSYTGRALAALPDDAARRRAYAERYFSTVRAALRRLDPEHLYLGCRFTRNFDQLQPVAEAAGAYVDVLSLNVYSGYPLREQLDQWYAAAGRPVLIGEHHIPPVTPRQLLPHWPAFPLDRRNAMVENYVYTWLDFPYAVGSHWYQYKDQEVAGRGDGGENQPVGLVTVTDKLNAQLVSTYADISREIPRRLLGDGKTPGQ